MVKYSYDELYRVALLLDEWAAECWKEGGKLDVPMEDRNRWVAEANAYEVSAKKLRKVMMTEG